MNLHASIASESTGGKRRSPGKATITKPQGERQIDVTPPHDYASRVCQ